MSSLLVTTKTERLADIINGQFEKFARQEREINAEQRRERQQQLGLSLAIAASNRETPAEVQP